MFRRSNGAGGAWTIHQSGASAVDPIGQTATFNFTASTQFGNQFVVGGNNNPLPVKLVSFEATPHNTDALLEWVTSSEENSDKFIIERSLDGQYFDKTGETKGKGNTGDLKHYSFTDVNASFYSGTVYYRLKMIDYDGRFSYSNTEIVSFGAKNGLSCTVQPNPFSNNFTIRYEAEQAGSVKIMLTNIQGAVVYSDDFITRKGSNEFNITPARTIASGMLFLQVSDKENIISRKLIKL